MNKNLIKILGCGVIIALLAIAFQMWNSSVQNDFNDISRKETYRLGDHYTGFYHRPGCPKLKQTYAGGVHFDTPEAAKEEGYSACKYCDPDGPNEE